MRRWVAALMTEAELMTEIRGLVDEYELQAFHESDSRRSWGKGFPDLVIAGPGGCIYRECKTEHGSLSPEQREWKRVLQASGQRWALWRPTQLVNGTIETELAAVASIQLELLAG